MKTMVLILLGLLHLAGPAAVQGQYTYATNADGVSITIMLYTGAGGAVAIPATINGLTVTSIGGLTNNDGVIVRGAFEQCSSLTSIAIPGSVTSIGDLAFADCANLASVTIPGSVTNLGEYAFYYCFGLTSIYYRGNAPAADSTVFENGELAAYYLAGTSGWTAFAVNTHSRTVLWNPLIQTGDGGLGAQNNQFGFNISGTNNFTVAVAASANLTSPVWVPLATNTLVNGSFHFSDPQWTNYPNRYYRLQMP